ncbi:hypothetical protein CPAR01_06505 [Colletotrichum paranaense]|uniref:AAA+ ATPase domain-containing protein n=1 Tax=Colletotrichum paranaense TaxID=1914294 RepID=A0ABQ9SN95_9PEZI|nr:uncharacterized protein CPAR01_06505 [Colletotrichum paranaense]KAK1540516.1 hypothetical protein CPAR01_06505 [Colletotrichum paranaense]
MASIRPPITPRPLPIVHLNGFPGSGKLTIARALQQQLSPCCRLVHNHLLINPADAVLHRSEAGYQDLRRALRKAVFTSLVESSACQDFVYVFTDFQSNDDIGSAVCAEYLETARVRGTAMVSIIITCDEATNISRLQSADREVHRKIVDPELLRIFRNGVSIHRFDEPGTKSVEVDVTELTPIEAARQILDHILRVCPDVERAVASSKLQ